MKTKKFSLAIFFAALSTFSMAGQLPTTVSATTTQAQGRTSEQPATSVDAQSTVSVATLPTNAASMVPSQNSAAVTATATGQAASPVFTLEECVNLALQNNAQVTTARNNVDAAVELRKEAFTKYFPEVSAMGFVFWANHDVLQYNVLDLIELGIIKNGKSAGVQLMQPVFTGGQIYNGNKLAEVGEEVARLRQSQTLSDLRLTTETLFWKLATLKSTRGTLEMAIATVDSIERQVQVAVDAGVAMRNDLLKVQLKRNTFRSEMVDLDNGIQLVKMLLGQYLGMGTEGNIDIVSDVPAKMPDLPYDIYLPPSDAVMTTIDYQLLNKNVQAKELERKMEIGKNLPMVAVGAGWYYHDLLGQSNNFGAIQIGVAIPISGWWGGSYAIKRKKIELMNAQNERDDLSQKLQLNIQDKWNNVTSSYRKMAIETEGIEQSAENLRLSKLYYEAGMNTITDLLEAETSFKEANVKFIAAYGAYRTALAQYLVASGR